jgi:hypothetical protein
MGLGTMYRLAYRNLGDHESLVASHTIAMDNAPASKSQTGIRWYEIGSPNATIPQVYQEGTAASETAGQYRWLGSIAMDRLGNIALGYNSSSTTLYPSINYIGRFATDPLGTMPYPEGLIMAGSGSQLGPNFGDYSAMQVDPEDECTFWYTGTYYKETSKNHWSTQIATFRFPDCEPPPIPEQATCGSANAHASVMSPTSGLCTVGIPGEVTTTAGDHHWTCSTGSGTPVQCTAPGGQIPGGSTRVTFEAPGCTTQSAGLNTAPKQKPGGIRMPYQMLYFQASQCPDKQANLRITYSDSVEELALWKTLTPNANNPSWVFVPEAKFSGNTLEVAIADNGPYDLDTRVGFIEDPIAPGTSNGKLAQPPLDFTINYSGVVCGMNVELLTTGGKGGGGIRYMVSRTGGTQCKIARNGGKGLLSTQGSLSDGSCTVRAIKGGDGRYNPTSSTAITIPVTCPSDLKK